MRFNRVDAPQSVSLKLKSPAFSMRSGFLYCGTLSSDRENSINRSPANADLSGNLCRSHASVTQLGDHFALTVDADGYPELPACLDCRKPKMTAQAA